jgi:hypothetical protein
MKPQDALVLSDTGQDDAAADLITLGDAAKELRADGLGMDQKTLRRKLQVAGLSPIPDPNDRRARVLTRNQFETFKRHLMQTQRRRSTDYTTPSLFGEKLSQEAVIMQASQVVKEWEELLKRREELLTEREKRLEQRIDTALAAFDQLVAQYNQLQTQRLPQSDKRSRSA